MNYKISTSIKRILLHKFRHFHQSHLINNGVSLLIFSPRLGHSDVATTLNIYNHLYILKQVEIVTLIKKDLTKKLLKTLESLV
ncbi:TPA: tyrosine-type recombinase/integrase [Bacillus thuringiensis]|nr:tyrosine-type recombinase/integrase [Bacillus thuringiensis]